MWIIITICAAFIQTIRNSFQKKLKNSLPTEIIALSRFLYSIPIALIILTSLLYYGFKLPNINKDFVIYILCGSIAQIIGNILLIKLFSYRNFVIGVTYGKTEAILSAIFGVILFAETLPIQAFFAIITGFIGIIVISIIEKHINPLKFIKSALNKIAIIGIAIGCCYALTGVLIRQSSLSLDYDNNILMPAIFTLLCMVTTQSLILIPIIFCKYDHVITKMVSNIKYSFLTGFFSGLASFGWFIAFTITKAAYVMTVGQVEILFSLFFTHKIFKEKINKIEYLGIMLVISSIILLIYFS